MDSEATGDANHSDAVSDQRELSDQPDSGIAKPRPLRRAAFAVFVGAVLIGLTQLIAPSTDHQIANLVSIVMGMITLMFVAYQLHRQFARSGHRFVVPVAVLAGLVALGTVFEADGFSGEMVPQFRLRFGRPEHRLRSLGTAVEPVDVAESMPSELVSDANSLGFLGNDRTGVVAKRAFSIPTDPSQVEVLWDQGIGQGWASFAVAGDRAVTLEQRDELECVTCYRVSDGELLWMENHEAFHQHPLGGAGPRSTPMIVGEKVYAQGATGVVWCLSLLDGEVLWTADLLEMAGWDQATSEASISWGRSGSPLIIDGMCVLPFGGPEVNASTGRSLIALDAETGSVAWTAGEDQISYSSPGVMTLAGLRQIVSVNEKTITGHKLDDGEVLWSFDWPGQSNGGANCAMQIPAGDNRFLIGKGYGGGSALVEVQRADGVFEAVAVWESSRLLKTKFNHSCVVGDMAYAIGNGSLEAVKISEGERTWVQPRRSRLGQGQILLVEDTIVGQAESGEVVLAAVDPNEYRELIRIPAMDAKTWNVPTVAGRLLLVRNDRQAICFRLPSR